MRIARDVPGRLFFHVESELTFSVDTGNKNEYNEACNCLKIPYVIHNVDVFGIFDTKYYLVDDISPGKVPSVPAS